MTLLSGKVNIKGVINFDPSFILEENKKGFFLIKENWTFIKKILFDLKKFHKSKKHFAIAIKNNLVEYSKHRN